MPALTSELILQLRDGVTGPARLIDAAVQKMGRTVATAFGAKNAQGFTAGAAALRREAAEMQKSAAAMAHGSHALGTALAGLGIGHGFGEFMKAGADYRKELVALKNSGKTQDEIAKSMRAAADVATALPTQTFADSIKIINETTAAYGDLGHALENLKFNSQFESNMKAVLGEHADPNMLQNMVRALEIRGTAFDPEKYQDEAGRLGKAFAFTRGAVNPENFYDFAKNANPDIKQFSTQFLTEVVPSLIQTFSAPGAGTGIKAFEKVWRGGLTDKSQAAEWVRVGMVSAQAVQDNKGQSPGWKSGAAAFSQLARENPLEAMTKLLEKLQKIGVDIADPNKLGPELDKLFKNGRARGMAYELGQAVTRNALLKDARLIRGSASMDEQYANNKDNLDKAKEAVKASFEDLMASMSGPLVTSAAHALWNIALGIQRVAATLHDHPLLGGALGITASVGTAVTGIAVLRSGLAMLGITGVRPFKLISAAMLSLRATALGTMAFMGRGALQLLTPLSLVRGAVVGIGIVLRGIVAASGIGAIIASVALIYQNWDNIRVAVEAFRGAFMRAIEPVRPILQPIIDDIARLWNGISSLIQPTSDMGDEWAKAGIKFGKLIGTDIVPWAQTFRTAYDWVKGLSEALFREDWAGAFGMIRKAADPVLTSFFTGWVQFAEQGATALMQYDWVGVGRRIVQAIIDYLLRMGGAIVGAIQHPLSPWQAEEESGTSAGSNSDPGEDRATRTGKTTFAPGLLGPKAVGVDPTLLALIKRTSAIVGDNLTIQSGFRSEAYNHMVGGARNSLHKQGRAVDLVSPGHPKGDRVYWLRVSHAYAEAAHEMGVSGARWGGRFTDYQNDNNHFDLGPTPHRLQPHAELEGVRREVVAEARPSPSKTVHVGAGTIDLHIHIDASHMDERQLASAIADKIHGKLRAALAGNVASG